MATQPPPPQVIVPWQRIEPLDLATLPVNGALTGLEKLRAEWESQLSQWSEAERSAVRQRELRLLAIETGILERIYDVDWGTTLTLVAEGITRDVIERSDGVVNDETLATLHAHLETLEMVLEVAAEDRPLTAHFIRELHAAITRTQSTHSAIDSLGRRFETELPRGRWKTQDNWVDLADGRRIMFCPPEQVASEIERLIELWTSLDKRDVHAVVKAAWLHHRFAQIHPFTDGNGRVARALVLLVMQKNHYAPLVVDRHHRDEYMASLEAATEGDLSPLVRLFASLQSAVLLRELARPDEAMPAGAPVAVAHALAAQLRAYRNRENTRRAKDLRSRLLIMVGHAESWFRQQASDLTQALDIGDPRVRVDSGGADPTRESEKLSWFRQQVIQSARTSGHYANLAGDLAWYGLRITVPLVGVRMRFVVSFHGVGREGDVMAATTFAELEWKKEDDDLSAKRQFVPTTKEAFVFLYNEPVKELSERVPDLIRLLNEGLTVAVTTLFRDVRSGGG
jgi:Fic family protein